MNNKIVDIKIINKDYNISAPPNTPEDMTFIPIHIKENNKLFHYKLIARLNQIIKNIKF
jgi:hypothetical protein